MAEQSEQPTGLEDAAGVLDDYESVLEQLAEEAAKREAAEKVVAETEAKLQAAKNAAATWDSDTAQLEMANLKVQVERERAARTKAEAEAAQACEIARSQATETAEKLRHGELQTALEQVAAEQKARAAAERQTRLSQAQVEAAQQAARQAASEAEAEKVARLAAEAAMVATTAKSAELEQAATRIQSTHRGRAARRELEEQHLAVAKIQSTHRGNAARKNLDKQHQAATKVQAVRRGNAARRTDRVVPATLIGELCGQREDGSKRPSVEEQELEAFTKAIVERDLEPEPEPEPEPEEESPPELVSSDAKRNAASRAEAADESQLLSEIMSELLVENPELSSEQVREAVVQAKGRRRLVAQAEYQAYARTKLSTRNLDGEMAQAVEACSYEAGTPAGEVRPKSVRGRARRCGTAHISGGHGEELARYLEEDVGNPCRLRGISIMLS
eukprot:COSAG02_NODE_12985_length_1464_cov_2.155311_1_plen_445_part_10